MGSECSCVKHENEQEFINGSGSGPYSFKKFVCNEIIKIILYLLYIIQYLPKDDNRIYYGKGDEYDKDVKNKIDRTSSLIRNGVTEYTNGNVEVIVPCPKAD